MTSGLYYRPLSGSRNLDAARLTEVRALGDCTASKLGTNCAGSLHRAEQDRDRQQPTLPSESTQGNYVVNPFVGILSALQVSGALSSQGTINSPRQVVTVEFSAVPFLRLPLSALIRKERNPDHWKRAHPGPSRELPAVYPRNKCLTRCPAKGIL